MRENHSLTPVEERHAAARILERLAAQRESLRLGLLDHPGHVREDHVGVLLLGQRVGLGPELLVALADGRNEVVFLHVARSERAVEVVDQCYGKSEFHRFQSFDFKAAKNQMAAKPYGMRFSVKPSEQMRRGRSDPDTKDSFFFVFLQKQRKPAPTPVAFVPVRGAVCLEQRLFSGNNVRKNNRLWSSRN